MTAFTVFTLAGVMASFGTVAGNERRGTLDRPGHSMLVGLLAAALGIRRNEEARLADLSDACRFAVRSDNSGNLLVDYHTVDTAKRRRGFDPHSRAEMLEQDRRYINTTITSRDYLVDIRYTIALAIEGDTQTHESVEEALKTPRFTLYLGRKSCPLCAPLAARILEADNPEAAFAAYDGLMDSHDGIWPGADRTAAISADARLVLRRDGRRESRRTLPVARDSWQFALLDELVLAQPARSGTQT